YAPRHPRVRAGAPGSERGGGCGHAPGACGPLLVIRRAGRAGVARARPARLAGAVGARARQLARRAELGSGTERGGDACAAVRGARALLEPARLLDRGTAVDYARAAHEGGAVVAAAHPVTGAGRGYCDSTGGLGRGDTALRREPGRVSPPGR